MARPPPARRPLAARSPPPVPLFGASRIEAFLQSTERQNAVHATIALTGAISRYTAKSRSIEPPASRDEVTAVNYSLAAAEAYKEDKVALEQRVDGQRRELVMEDVRHGHAGCSHAVGAVERRACRTQLLDMPTVACVHDAGGS